MFWFIVFLIGGLCAIIAIIALVRFIPPPIGPSGLTGTAAKARSFTEDPFRNWECSFGNYVGFIFHGRVFCSFTSRLGTPFSFSPP
jgi:hypothetical protein